MIYGCLIQYIDAILGPQPPNGYVIMGRCSNGCHTTRVILEEQDLDAWNEFYEMIVRAYERAHPQS